MKPKNSKKNQSASVNVNRTFSEMFTLLDITWIILRSSNNEQTHTQLWSDMLSAVYCTTDIRQNLSLTEYDVAATVSRMPSHSGETEPFTVHRLSHTADGMQHIDWMRGGWCVHVYVL